MENKKLILSGILGVLIVWGFLGCQSLPMFDETAYNNVVTLRAESLGLMDKMSESFEDHREDVAKLKEDLSGAYNYAYGIPGNNISTSQWSVLINENRNLIGGVLKKWETEGALRELYIIEKKKDIDASFGELEKHEKTKPIIGGLIQ